MISSIYSLARKPLSGTTVLKSLAPRLQTSSFSTTKYVLKEFVPPSKSSMAEGVSNGPLQGIRVLDLTRVLAGPYCTMLLGDLGAEVIKVENPKNGDDTRAWGPPWASSMDAADTDLPESAYFLCNCDVLVENYLPGKLEKMGLGYEQLKEINPKLIYASITGYGQDGPYANRPGYDVMIEAEAGLMHITGERNGQPVKVGVAITGLYAHGAIMASIIRRATTGLGQHIDCSLLDCQVASLANIASNYLVGNQEAQRMGTSHPSIVPYQVMPTKNSFVMIGAGNDGQFAKLCKSINREELLLDPRFKTNGERVKHRVELLKLLEDRLTQEDTEHWLEALTGSGIPFAPINNIEQTFHHPQVLARDMVQEVDHPRAGKIKVIGIPVKYSESKPSIRLAPPVLGQHTNEILEGILGYSSAKVSELRSEGVIGK
ncbi:hypothetical protein NQZ79_g6463 [Umbelopsis isabellina]|nr:hypothetical protein NQZ79_g6463 [Umbelopsis isabellina]